MIANALISLAGVALLAVTLADVVGTTLVFTNAGGPLTRHLTRALWLLAPRRAKLARFAGPAILLAIVVTWLGLSWLAWLLIFLGSPDAVVDAQTRAPADLASRLYFAGFSLFTLGVGDVVPNGGLWQILSVVSAGQGFFVITLSITYILPVVTSVTERRQLASQLHLLGESPAAVLVRHWNGDDFGPLEDRLSGLLPPLVLLEQRHFTYPVMHYFVERDRRVAIEPNVVVLDEALTLLAFGLGGGLGPSPAVVEDLRGAVGHYLDTALGEPSRAPARAPPAPSLEPLRRAGLPVASEAEFASALKRVSERRARLGALLGSSAALWRDPAGDEVR